MKNILLTCLFITSLAQAAEVISFSETNAPHTRALAASCAACHGTKGNAVQGNAVLAGMDATYFTTQMLAFKEGTRVATVMHRHAKGLTTEEINALAAYFTQQKPVAGQTPKPQTLGASHD